MCLRESIKEREREWKRTERKNNEKWKKNELTILREIIEVFVDSKRKGKCKNRPIVNFKNYDLTQWILSS